MTRAVFLDRDGVLVRTEIRDGRPYALRRLEDMELLPGVEAALDRLRRAGLLNVMVTNQPDVATGLQERSEVEAMHRWLRGRLPLDGIRVCRHVDADGCRCRKPKPGMLLDAARRHHIDLAASFMVGDRWRDVGAGKAAGCVTIWIDRGYDEPRGDDADHTVTSLSAAVAVIEGEITRSSRQ